MKKVPFSSQHGGSRTHEKQASERVMPSGGKKGKPQSGMPRSMEKQSAEREKVKTEASVGDTPETPVIKSVKDLRKTYNEKYGKMGQEGSSAEEAMETPAQEAMEGSDVAKEGMKAPTKKKMKKTAMM